MTTKTKPRRFFSCPIQALYMMKEFGVKLQGKYAEWEINQGDEEFFSFEHIGLGEPEMIEDLLEAFKEPWFERIYVAPESEAIFEPKDGDKGTNKNNHILTYVVDDRRPKGDWGNVFGFSDEKKIEAKIIMRDNKNFFSGKVENAN